MRGIMEAISEEVLFELRWGGGEQEAEEDEEVLEAARTPGKYLTCLRSKRRKAWRELQETEMKG